jgi:hypothetical protein
MGLPSSRGASRFPPSGRVRNFKCHTGFLALVRHVRHALRSLALGALVCAGLSFATVAPANAYLPLRLKPFARAAGPLYTDGSRWAAFEVWTGTTRVIDARTGHSVDRPDPAGCFGGDGGGLLAVGGGELLYACENPVADCPPEKSYGPDGCEVESAVLSARYVVVDAATGIQHAVVGENHLPIQPESDSRLIAVGSQWVAGDNGGALFLVNWHTGERKRDEPSKTEVQNLSTPALFRPLCRPIHRHEERESPALGAFIFRPLEYRPPFAIESEELQRCGSAKRDPIPMNAESQLGGNILSGIFASQKAGAMYATRLRAHGARLHGSIYLLLGPKTPIQAKRVTNWTLQHTATTVYQSADISEAGIGIGDLIYAARVP